MNTKNNSKIIAQSIAVIIVVVLIGWVFSRKSSVPAVTPVNTTATTTPVASTTVSTPAVQTPVVTPPVVTTPVKKPTTTPKPVVTPSKTPTPTPAVTPAPSTPAQTTTASTSTKTPPPALPVQPTPATPKVTIISPNGGESFHVGDTMTITFNIVNVNPTSVVVNLNDKNNNSTTNILSSSFDANKDGATKTFTWIIPRDTLYNANNSFRIQVTSTDGSVSDYSDGYFTIIKQ